MRLSSLVRPFARARRRCAGERGTTLVELLTVTTILTIVVGGLTGVFVSASHAELDMNRRFQAQQEARLALDTLRREIHCADTVTQVGGGALAQGGAYSGITINLASYCLTGTGAVTWCTRTSTQNSSAWALWRMPGSACPESGGLRKADYITSNHVFSLPATPPSGLHLATINVSFPVNIKPGSSIGSYRLADDIALRNSVRQ